MFLQIYTIVFAQIRIHQTSAQRRAGRSSVVFWKNLPTGGPLDTQDLPSGKSEASLRSRAAPQDFPWEIPRSGPASLGRFRFTLG